MFIILGKLEVSALSYRETYNMDENKTNPLYFPPNGNAIVRPRKNRDRRLRHRAVVCARCQHIINHPSNFKPPEKVESLIIETSNDGVRDLRKRKRTTLEVRMDDAVQHPSKRLCKNEVCKNEVKGINVSVTDKSNLLPKSRFKSSRGLSKNSVITGNIKKKSYKSAIKKKLMKASTCVHKKDKANNIVSRSNLTPLKCKVNLLRNSLNMDNGSDVIVKSPKFMLQSKTKSRNMRKAMITNVKTTRKQKIHGKLSEKMSEYESTVTASSKKSSIGLKAKVLRHSLDSNLRNGTSPKVKPSRNSLDCTFLKQEISHADVKSKAVTSVGYVKSQKPSEQVLDTKSTKSQKMISCPNSKSKVGRPSNSVKVPKQNADRSPTKSTDVKTLKTAHNGLRKEIHIRAKSNSHLNLKNSESLFHEDMVLNNINVTKSKLFSSKEDLIAENKNQSIIYHAGDVVWGKISGFPWWPALVQRVDRRTKGNQQMVTIAWFGSNTKSVVHCDTLATFLEHYKAYFCKRKRGTYLNAVRMAKRKAENKIAIMGSTNNSDSSEVSSSEITLASECLATVECPVASECLATVECPVASEYPVTSTTSDEVPTLEIKNSSESVSASDIEIADNCFVKMSSCDLTSLNSHNSDGENEGEIDLIAARFNRSADNVSVVFETATHVEEDSDSDVIEVITDAQGNLIGAKTVNLSYSVEEASNESDEGNLNYQPAEDEITKKNHMNEIVEQTVSNMVQKAVCDIVEQSVSDMVEKSIHDISGGDSMSIDSLDEIILECNMSSPPSPGEVLDKLSPYRGADGSRNSSKCLILPNTNHETMKDVT